MNAQTHRELARFIWSITKDGFDHDKEGKRFTFDYMLANPPFGVEWKQQQRFIVAEAELGHAGRFGAGLVSRLIPIRAVSPNPVVRRMRRKWR